MGKAHRERLARILAGGETLIRKQVIEKMATAGTTILKHETTSNQIKFLADSLHSGRLHHDQLRHALMGNAPNEMRIGAEKLRKQGKSITVDNLLEEYWADTEFKELAAEVGLSEDFFVKLAEAEVAKC